MLDPKKSCEHCSVWGQMGWCLDCVQKLFSAIKVIKNIYDLKSIHNIVDQALEGTYPNLFKGGT